MSLFSSNINDVESWEQLKVALHDEYGEMKNIDHLQLEMSSARQNKDEDVRAFSERLNSILSSLAIQMTENKDKNVKSAIYDVLEQQRHNAFIEGLRQPIKFLMKSKNIRTYEDVWIFFPFTHTLTLCNSLIPPVSLKSSLLFEIYQTVNQTDCF